MSENVTDGFLFSKPQSKNIDKKDTSHINTSTSKSQPMTEVSMDAECYNLNHYRRGKAIIFNHYKYDDSTLNKREGTQKDGTNLSSVLKKLSFDVEVYDDLKFGAIDEVLSDAAKKDHSDSDCLLIAVMSHGDHGKIYAKDHSYPTDMLWMPFTGDKCKTLAGKPKIFLIQACRGEEVDSGVRIRSVETDSSPTYSIPVMADILIMYSTYDGYYSWRSPVSGSWFIQSICSEFEKYAKDKDVLTILTFVNRKMATEYRSCVPGSYDMDKKKQIGTIVSTLTRLVYLHPKSY